LYLLAFGALLYWQLNQVGSVVVRALSHSRLRNTQLADPLLLIGPSLLLFALALVMLRIWPFPLRLAARLCRPLRGWLLPLGLFRLARNPRQANRVVLLVSLTVGLMLFTHTFRSALADSQQVPPGHLAGSAPQADVLAQGISGALQLNTLTLLLFSVTAFFLVHLVAAQERVRSQWGASEFSVLRAMGVSVPRLLVLFGMEGLLLLVLGLLTGTVVGLGLSYVMVPYLSQVLGQLPAAVTTGQILGDWPAIAQFYLILFATYGMALVLLLLILMRTRAHRALWLEDR
jgi:hypothetical protein